MGNSPEKCIPKNLDYLRRHKHFVEVNRDMSSGANDNFKSVRVTLKTSVGIYSINVEGTSFLGHLEGIANVTPQSHF